ncbi:Cycloartenol-C-24-methyltransferase [Actinidia chinensis var. chinensis]|uniref:Methyltransferase n=1 Tax=Actinidia chinensis var. chinensis TaxID=1590841 RepID=A0A2R6PGR0_ACTCC|nr:Cycloartenol-C-24-methyltransferase [Actinidia chinensis var. chinensis]
MLVISFICPVRLLSKRTWDKTELPLIQSFVRSKTNGYTIYPGPSSPTTSPVQSSPEAISLETPCPVNKYYDLVTSFYEYGWGESFHFAPRWKGESLRESIKRHEHFLALQLGLKQGHKVLDVGCGIGGPLREIARFSDTHVTGVNNNEYQITRGTELNRIAGVNNTCNYVKPGRCFAAYEWCITDSFDLKNEEHQRIKGEVELGNGLLISGPWDNVLKLLNSQVLSHFSLSNFRVTAVGRFMTRNMVKALERVGLAPEGSQRVQAFLEKAADALVEGGRDTHVTGVNNNEYQITRGTELNHIAGVNNTCNYVKADFMNMPFSDNSFDAIFAIEATCHAPDVADCYKEIYRVLKPGQCFAAYEWCITDSFDPKNEEHHRIKGEVELGNGLPDIRSMGQCFEALILAGFEVIWEKDFASDSPLPWYLPLDKSHFSLSNFRVTAVGRFMTRNMVKALERVGLAPEGSQRVQAFLEKAADALVEGGRKGIFTPMYFFLARKPHL